MSMVMTIDYGLWSMVYLKTQQISYHAVIKP
jgi:hypothetical protein